MRIISGKHKGRQFSPSRTLPVRPTTNRAKEALFNILQHEYDFDGLQVLDLFAGTGNISYEFLSRGVAEVTAVDKSPLCIKYIKETARLLGERIHTSQNDVFDFLQKYPAQNHHLIFADPPYNFDIEPLQKLIRLVFEKRWLDQKIGMLIVEHRNKISLEQLPLFCREKRYGNSVFSFFDG